MNKIINIGPLPFYEDISKQQHRKAYAFGQMWPLIVELGRIPSFQFMGNPSLASANGQPINNINLVRVDSAGNIIWVQDLPDTVHSYVTMIGYETHTTFITHDTEVFSLIGLEGIVNKIEPGYYFLQITDNTGTEYYSEIFVYCENVKNMLKLEYTNSYNFKIAGRDILFDGAIRAFRPSIYLDTQLGKPAYNFEEEVVSRLGYEYVESQVSKKQYNFSFVAPEYLLDALRFVRLCNNKKCIVGDEEYDMLNFNIEPQWGEQGDLASVEASFEVDNIVANIGGLIQ